MSNNLTEKLNDSLDDRVDRLITAVQSMDSRLGSLETKVDQRLRDTQPIWEAVQSQLAEIRESQQRLVESQQRLVESQQSLVEDLRGLRAEVASLRADTEKGFRTFDRRMERQIGEFERLHAYQRDLEDRVDKLEKISTP